MRKLFLALIIGLAPLVMAACGSGTSSSSPGLSSTAPLGSTAPLASPSTDLGSPASS